MPPARAGILLSELCHVVEALRSLRGRVVTKAWVPRPHLTLLEVGGVVLRIEAAPVPRVHPTAARPPSPPKPLSFQGLLRARLVGRPFELAMPFEDRVIEVRTPEGALHARLFGAGGGVWWVEGDRVVAASHGPSGPLPPLPDRGVTDAAPRFAPEGDETWADAARRWFEASTAAGESVDRLAAARLAGAREVRRLDRLLRNLETDLEAALGADDLRLAADGLAAVIHQVRRGATSWDVPDLRTGEGTRAVALDPAQPATATLTRMYDRAGRLARAQDHVIERIGAVEAERAEVQAALAALDRDPEPAIARLTPRPAAPRAREAAAQGWWTWRGPEDRALRVGRNAAGNHRLVFRASRGRDWWLHLRDAPSAHVVVPSADGAAPDPATLAAAVEALLLTARVPEGVQVDVRLARVADLRPVPGGHPGEVQITRERVIVGRRDPSALHGWIRADVVPRGPRGG